MATELWKLRQQVEDLLNTRSSEFDSEGGDGASASHKHRPTQRNEANGELMSGEQRIGENSNVTAAA